MGDMTNPSPVSYGPHVLGDADLRLCGDLQGKRVVELGIGRPSSALALAEAGAKVIVVDPSPEAIEEIRRRAEAAEVRVECHVSDLADLGFVTSASVDVVLLIHRMGDVDDLARLLRQLHRILKPEMHLVIAMEHPAHRVRAGDAMNPARRYGADSRTLGEIFMAFQRSNFQVDQLHELDADNERDALTPAVLVLRVRKLGV
jgi:ubiquinone/menaquinone biosynthesis C-methylase UbiE